MRTILNLIAIVASSMAAGLVLAVVIVGVVKPTIPVAPPTIGMSR